MDRISVILFCSFILIISRVECFDLTIIHTNDVHAKFEEYNKYQSLCSPEESMDGECFGGIARRVTIAREIRNSSSENGNVLYLNAGDSFQGTLWYHYYQGAATAYFTRRLGIDAACLGNHEFDDGIAVLSSYLRNISFPMLACNLDSSREPALANLYQPSLLLNVGGQNIGLVGYITRETTKLVSPVHVENLVFEDEVESIRREVNAFLAAGVNKIIVLGHGGFLLDQKIAEQVEGIDVIVGGHSNTFLYTGDPPSDEEPIGPYPYVVEQDNGAKVLLVQAYAYGKYMGYLELTFSDSGLVTSYRGNPILLDNSVVQDADTLEELEVWREPLTGLLTKEIGKTYVFLNGMREECRARECNMGNVLTDAVIYSYLIGPEESGRSWTDIAIAVWNGGAIRANIDQGMVTISEVMEVFPFRNEVVGFTVPGHVIKEMLEHSVEEYNLTDLKGKFLQMSGIKVKYDLWKPAGQRVVDVQVRCADCMVPRYEDLDPDKMYGILTSEFMFYGGDGYTMFQENIDNIILSGEISADVVIDYFTEHPPVFTGLEGRISFTEHSVPPVPSTGYRHMPAATFIVTILVTMIMIKGSK